MPKIINGLKEKLHIAGKKIMLEQGYEALTIKKVADCCEVGVGTVYNYYSSKKELLASILWSDWECVYANIQTKCKSTENVLDVFEVIYTALGNYVELYQSLFFSTSSAYDSRATYTEQQLVLREQISVVVSQSIDRLNCNIDSNIIDFIIDNIIGYSMRMVPYENLREIFNKLIIN